MPYEGEQAGEPSRTDGGLSRWRARSADPLRSSRTASRRSTGSGPEAGRCARSSPPTRPRANIAEVAFGCNDWAVVTGNVLEDEKAGFHWAYGRSDHLGGASASRRSSQPGNVVHQDIVYAKGNPIQVAEATSVRPDGTRTRIIRNGAYIVF